jgi:hypothetical protein
MTHRHGTQKALSADWLIRLTTGRVLASAAIGTALVVIVGVLPNSQPWHVAMAALLGAWLWAAAALVAARPRGSRVVEDEPTLRAIPLSFSGSTGRFKLRPRGDGRRVEVHAEGEVVAQAIATDFRDEIIVVADAIPDAELGDLGAALGQAIEMVAAADEDGIIPESDAAVQDRYRIHR